LERRVLLVDLGEEDEVMRFTSLILLDY